jgi:hypothetical protein
MEKTKLIQLLRTFDSKELRAFHDFVRSPFFNKQEEIVQLYTYLKKQAKRDFPPARITKQTVFQQLFPDQVYDEKRLNHFISQLFKLAEKFIGYQQYQKAGAVSAYYSLQAYVERRKEKPYRYLYDQAQKKLAERPQRNANYHFQRFLLADVAERHFSNQNIRRHDQSLQEAADHLDHYYLAQKLKFVCAMLDRQKQLNTTYSTHMIDEVKQYLARQPFEHVPAVHIYYVTLLTLTNPDETDNFYRLQSLLKSYQSYFEKNELKDLYYFAINYCARRIRVGKKSFATDLMTLYIEGIDHGILLDEGRLSPWTFKNMVRLGLGLKRFEWVESFVPKYYSYLPENEREAAFHFSMADLYFQKKAYEKAFFHLNQVEFSDIFYSLGAKVMLLKIYHEKEETEALIALLKSFRIYLKRNKLIAKNVKLPYLNFIHLLAAIQKKDKQDTALLLKEIQEVPQLMDRSWLLQQVAG